MRALLLLLLVVSTTGCEPRDLTFASLPWGLEAAEVRDRMAERGFSFVAVANDRGDQLYAGRFAGHRAVLVTRMGAGRLAKLEIGVQPEPGEERVALFASLEERLEAEYGSTRGTARLEEGAAGWLDAAGGAPARRRVWSRGGARGESYLILEDRPELAIVVAFESPAWHAEFLRRQGR